VGNKAEFFSKFQYGHADEAEHGAAYSLGSGRDKHLSGSPTLHLQHLIREFP
jgi:hypothetical protein